MNITEGNKQLRLLTDAHESYKISLLEYRQQRKQILDALDKNLNGIAAQQPELHAFEQPQAAIPASVSVDNQDVDKTQPYFSAKLGQCFSFLKGKNER